MGRPLNKDLRPREYLTTDEVKRLMKAAKTGNKKEAKKGGKKHGHRNSTMILVAFVHGLRLTELLRLKWNQINFKTNQIQINRLKNGTPSIQPMPEQEIRRLKRIKKSSPYVFVSHLNLPLTPKAFQLIVKEAGENAGFEFPLHPHMLRHALGYKLADDNLSAFIIRAVLGHTNMSNTLRYVALSPNRLNCIQFNNL